MWLLYSWYCYGMRVRNSLDSIVTSTDELYADTHSLSRVSMLSCEILSIHRNMTSKKHLMAICVVARGTDLFWMLPRALQLPRVEAAESLWQMVELAVVWKNRMALEDVAKVLLSPTEKRRMPSLSFQHQILCPIIPRQS